VESFAVLDFETKPIERRPDYPPKPVSFSVKIPDRPSEFFAWGHPSANNCAVERAHRVLKWLWSSDLPIVTHNGKFDLDVAETHFRMPRLPWQRVHDTMTLAFLVDPHAPSFALKPLAQRLLGMNPKERDTVAYWLVEHQEDLKRDRIIPMNEPRISVQNAGKWISAAPGDIVGPYADGDVLRTERLFKRLYPRVVKDGMLEAYQREQRLMPILLDNEREGIHVDVRALGRDVAEYTLAMDCIDDHLRIALGNYELNIDSNDDLAAALDAAGVVTDWTLTATGKRSTSKKNMGAAQFKNERLRQMLAYRNRLATCLGTFMRPWLETARKTGGIIHTNWNQTRSPDGGARTGRMSSSPNFQNIPKDFADKGDGYQHPDHTGVPELPLMRRYILPDSKDHWFVRTDQSQQELRLLGHFENDALVKAYLRNPKLDVHRYVQEAIGSLLGIDIPRTPVKTLNFGLIYGQGVVSMATALQRTVAEITRLRQAQFKALPGLKALDKDLKDKGRADNLRRADKLKPENPIKTWGGRLYYVEESRPDERDEEYLRTFEYKLLNYLIQGSAADVTKEIIIRYSAHPERRGRLLCSVHDEFDRSVPKGGLMQDATLMREVIASIELNVPMLSDCEYGPNWAQMRELRIPTELDLSRWGIKKGWSQ
jgi:DNA polymerase I-like protein with 3'-5' exonuclease and polymerase domains